MVWFRKKRQSETPEKKEENVLLNSKNGQLKGMKSIIDAQQILINDLTEQMTAGKKGNTEDKLVDAVIQLFAPSPPMHTVESQQVLETGQQFSDAEISQKLSLVPKSTLQQLVQAGKDHFINTVKNKISNISDESSERAFELAKVMV